MKKFIAVVFSLMLVGCVGESTPDGEEVIEEYEEYGVGTLRLAANGSCNCNTESWDNDCDYRFIPAVGTCFPEDPNEGEWHSAWGGMENRHPTDSAALWCSFGSDWPEGDSVFWERGCIESIRFLGRDDNNGNNSFSVYSWDPEDYGQGYEGSCSFTTNGLASCLVDDLTIIEDAVAIWALIEDEGTLFGAPAFSAMRVCYNCVL